ncbi:MAG: adenylate kinase [Acidobacteriota bacterium]|nr:adenylate kinase [Acidobacteriota bacterium]
MHPLPKASDFLPGPLLMLGAPGAGKGTQAQLLMAEFGIPQISTGDLLRQHRRDHTTLGMMAEGLMKEGKFVPDDLVNEMVAERLAEPDTEHGYILDGFPRTLVQAEWLDTKLVAYMLPVVAVCINVDRDVLLKRITGRRISKSGAIYNIYTNPPKVDGICDVDGSRLEQRADDSEAVFHERMKAFHQKTSAVIEYYRSHGGRFAEVDGDRPVEDVLHGIRKALLALRHHPDTSEE